MSVYPTPYPTYYPHRSHHHQASAYPNLYQTSTYSLPVSPNGYEVPQSDYYTMPSYYVQGQPSYRSHNGASRSRTRSYSQSGTGYSQPAYYTSGGVHHRDYAYGDSGTRHRSSSVGHGGYYYYPSGHSGSRQQGSSYSYSPQYYTSGHRRSYSTPRRSSVQVVDARRSSRSHRPSVSYVDTSSRGSNYYYHEPLGDRIRRWFGLGPSQHHHQSPWRGTGYVDARTGRSVDARGRPVYRV
ncbi:hypothetical protein NM688_g102 [Phlebia brevispora]|uniref:Uncharacterized protein n=1 Tax=Phlebia brevispora TaxID=194682 RepID=A0ACC1TF12_9APHY|nr:hypothetical protein NM688_g102 [Phlebia brevispora]